MASSPYSFIDIAVLDEVRARFAAGDALAILSVDLEEAVWANGPGAALLGYPDIESVMGGPAGLGLAARRQIAATPGFPRMGRDRPVAVRLASGITSRAVTLLVSGITLPDGEPAVLIAVPARAPGSLTSSEIARRTVGGFGEAGYFAALVDADARLLAASDGFDRLGIAPATLVRLIDEVARQDDRLIKRLIPAGDTRIPAGFARLTDEPALHLLIAVDEPVEATDDDGPAAPSDADLPERVEEDRSLDPGPAGEPVTEDPEDEAAVPPLAAPGDTTDSQPAQKTAGDAPAPLSRRAIPAGPVRFVWRTDAAGAFSAISPEFAEAVGAQAAAVIGRRFADVADEFGLDPQGEVAGLLERRDTWSGRSVMWPVEGTDLVAPVDLAALPVYSRDRTFEGFRGFGVARMADVVADPAARGLRLGMPEPAGEEARPEPAQPVEPEESAPAEEALPSEHEPLKKHGDPFRGEVPVISIAERRERRQSDKVIRLAEHRTPPAPPERQLSPTERNAFEEIRARLRKDYEADERNEKAAGSPAAGDDMREAADATGEHPQAGDAGTALPPDTDAAAAPEAAEPPVEAGEEHYDAPYLAALDAGETDEIADGDDVAEGTEAAAAAPHADEADRPDEAAGSDSEPAVEVESAAGQDEPAAVEAEPPADETEPQVGETAADASPDRAASADAPPPIDAGAGATEEAPEPGPTPALATSGFLPSAFSIDEGRAGVDAELIAGLPIPLLVHAGDDLYFANREFLSLTGYASLDQIRKEGGLDRLFVDRDPREAPGPAGRKLHLRTLGGDTFPVDAYLQSIRWRAGSALLLSVRRIEASSPPAPAVAEPPPHDLAEVDELAARVAEMRTIIDTATDGVVLIALDGTIRNISRPAEALFGFDSAEVEGEPFASLFAIESQRAARDYLNGLAENGVASVLNDGREVIGREAEGRFIPLFMTIGRLPGDSGYCAVVRDITQWKRAEEDLTQARSQAERASSQKTEFLARVSHEIRTPLNAIIGFSELMIDEKFGPIGSDRYRDYLRDINRSGNHVLDLVNDLLDISKIEAGEQEMHYEAVSLNDTLAESVALMQPQANRDRVIIRSSLASRLPEVVADLRSVRQIALNLLSNAIRYTQAGGQVIVSTAYEPSGDVVMRVRDTGVGMSISEIDQALKPFKQINALKRGRHDGTGLGLPLTKAMVEANRASFSIASTPGQGTMVEITFPSTRVLAD